MELPHRERIETLLPLMTCDNGDTRLLAGSLLRQIGPPAELAPAAVPAAPGSEPVPAEVLDRTRAVRSLPNRLEG